MEKKISSYLILEIIVAKLASLGILALLIFRMNIIDSLVVVMLLI